MVDKHAQWGLTQDCAAGGVTRQINRIGTTGHETRRQIEGARHMWTKVRMAHADRVGDIGLAKRIASVEIWQQRLAGLGKVFIAINMRPHHPVPADGRQGAV